MRYVYLTYDLPEAANIRNPSYRLRRIGWRINKSDWAMAEESTPYHLIDELRAQGASVHVVRFDEGESSTLAGMAAAALLKDIEETARGVELSALRAAAQL